MSDQTEIDKWFFDPASGNDWQDMDYILAEIDLLPRLKVFLDDGRGSTEKKSIVILALLEILKHDFSYDGGIEAIRRADDIKKTIRLHIDAARNAMSEAGPVQEAALRIILGLPLPPDCPQCVVDQAKTFGA